MALREDRVSDSVSNLVVNDLYLFHLSVRRQRFTRNITRPPEGALGQDTLSPQCLDCGQALMGDLWPRICLNSRF